MQWYLFNVLISLIFFNLHFLFAAYIYLLWLGWSPVIRRLLTFIACLKTVYIKYISYIPMRPALDWHLCALRSPSFQCNLSAFIFLSTRLVNFCLVILTKTNPQQKQQTISINLLLISFQRIWKWDLIELTQLHLFLVGFILQIKNCVLASWFLI